MHRTHCFEAQAQDNTGAGRTGRWLQAVLAGGLLLFAAMPGRAETRVLVRHAFDGDGAAGLNGTDADTFDEDVVTAGGSAAWVAHSSFTDDGGVDSSVNSSAHLNLGAYINQLKGTAGGKFFLTATISETSGAWLSLGFSIWNNPTTTQNFTFTGTPGVRGVGTVLYRIQAHATPGQLALFGGQGTANGKGGPHPNSGPRTLTVTLDLTPDGGYDGMSNFGTVTWSDSVLGDIGTHTFTSATDFGSILLSSAASGGTYSHLTLEQIDLPPPPLVGSHERTSGEYDLTELSADGDWAIWEGAYDEASVYAPTDRKAGVTARIGNLSAAGVATGIGGSTAAWADPSVSWTDGTTIATRDAAEIFGGGLARPLNTVGAALALTVTPDREGEHRAYFLVHLQRGSGKFTASLAGVPHYVHDWDHGGLVGNAAGSLYTIEFTCSDPATDMLSVTYELTEGGQTISHVRVGAVALSGPPHPKGTIIMVR